MIGAHCGPGPLAVFYLCDGRSPSSVARAAQSLSLHKNSMYYRIERIGELTGVDLSDERERLVAQLALAARQLGRQTRV